MLEIGVCIGTKPAEVILSNHAKGNVSQGHRLDQFWQINLYHPEANSSISLEVVGFVGFGLCFCGRGGKG